MAYELEFFCRFDGNPAEALQRLTSLGDQAITVIRARDGATWRAVDLSRNDSYAPLLVQFHGNDSATKAEVSVVADDDGAPDLSAVNSLLEVTLSGEVDWGLVNLIADFARQNWGGIPYDEESGFSVTFNIEET